MMTNLEIAEPQTEKPGGVYVGHILDLLVRGPFSNTEYVRNSYRIEAAWHILDLNEAEDLAEALTIVCLQEGEMREAVERGEA